MSDLRRRIIRLAAEAEPALKRDLLAILKDQADPASHDQNLPETYYGLPPKSAASGDFILRVEKGKGRGSYPFKTVEEAVGAAGSHGSFSLSEKERGLALLRDGKPWSVDSVPGSFTIRPAKGKVAASGPAADGKNWKEKSDSKGAVRHIWTAPPNSDSAIDSFTVFEKVGLRGEKSFTMNVLMNDGEIYKRSGPEDIGRLFSMAARLFESSVTPGFDLGSQHGWTKV